MDYSIARKLALRLLSMRNYHTAMLQRKLERKGCSKEICERVIEDCKRIGLFNDEDAILRELRRGYGPRAIECKLHLSREEVRRAITRDMQRQRIAEWRAQSASREKAIRALQRRGFDLDLVIEIFSLSEIE
ncbi:MAG: RecX family transcriptional regulator [Chlamydiales bacterium]